jgi:alkanesulfonate monooxygenase SsuD/methylene tetrahydromethanopterin reductase-like flavin-dependent oxidoreductase (luciferase family)
VGRLDEAAHITKRMWTEEAPSFEGRYYRIEDAHCSPKPVQRPHPPIMLAGSGEQLTLKTVARHADMSNFAAWMGSPSDFRHKAEVLRRHCVNAGRDFDEITLSWANYTLISRDRGSAEMSLDRYTNSMQARYGDAAGDRRPPLCGTPDDVIEQIQTYIDAGVTLFINRFMGDSFREGTKLFADEVIPSFQA